MATIRLILAATLLYGIGTSVNAQDFRYTNLLFPSAAVTSDVVYGTAPFINFPFTDESNVSNEDLVMDIFQPQGDNFTSRAAVVFAHSGGFITGNRSHDDMIAACDSLARKGYVTATIDYRQGFNVLTDADMHGTRAVYRGIQDGRAAVRFLRANAAIYGIDPNQVYLAGSSAGSFISLHSIYMDEPQEKPEFAGPVTYTNFFPPFFYNGPDLGPVDVGDNLDQDGTPAGVVAWWGAIEDTDLILPQDNEGVFLAHGTDDPTVPFVTGPPFSLPTFPDVDGSFRIDSTLGVQGQSNRETYFVSGAGHEFHGTNNGSWENGSGGNEFWDTLMDKTTQFLWQQHKPLADFSFQSSGLSVAFSDESTGALSWNWDFGDGQISTDQNPVYQYATPGTYQVSLYIENDIRSWDTISLPVVVNPPLPVVWAAPLDATVNKNDVVLRWWIEQSFNHSHFDIEYLDNTEYFRPIGRVDDILDGGVQSFDFIHSAPGKGLHTYRIKQTDQDGRFSYSTLASASINHNAWFTYPNPSGGVINISGLGIGTSIRLFDVLGRIQIETTAESQTLRLNLTELPKGTYILSVDGDGQQRIILR